MMYGLMMVFAANCWLLCGMVVGWWGGVCLHTGYEDIGLSYAKVVEQGQYWRAITASLGVCRAGFSA